MRKILVVAWLSMAVCASALPISEEGKQQARLFNTFLEASYLRKDNPRRAFALLQQALEQEPQSKFLRQQLVALALVMEEPQRAAPYADFISSNDEENDAEDWAIYAAYQVQQNNIPAALQAYEKALEKAPDNAELLYQYLLLLSATDTSKAIAVLEEFAQQHPASAAQAYTQIARFYVRQQRLPQALEYLDKAIAADPQEVAPRLLKGELYEQTSQFFLMLHEFEELEKLGYVNAGMFARMAAVFLVVKDLPKAKAYFLKAKAADPADKAANYFLSMFAEEEQDYAQAIAYLQEAADYTSNASRWLQVSFLQQKQNDSSASLKTLAQAYKRFEGNVEIAFFYGLALNDSKQYKKAARVFRKLLQERPDYVDARLHYAYALESLKKYKDMETQIRLILDKQPQHAAALNLLAYSLAERETRLDEALELAKRAVAVAPQDISFQDTLGWVYLKQGDLAQAASLFESIPADTLSQYPEIVYHLAVLRLKQGRTQDALTLLQQVRSTWPAAGKLYKQLSR